MGAIEEACAVAQAEGASEIVPERAVQELERAHATLGSSMQRDIAAGREPELDAIPGAVLRAASRHGLCAPRSKRSSGDPRPDRGRQPRLEPLGAREPPVRSPRRCGAGASRRGSPGWRSPPRPPAPRPRGVLVLAVAEHPEVARHAPVGVDRDAGQDLLALLEARAAPCRSGPARCHRRYGWGSRDRGPPRPARIARGSWRSSPCPPSLAGSVARFTRLGRCPRPTSAQPRC